MIHQGEIYWVDLPSPTGSGPGGRRPYVVVQNNLFNRSGVKTIVVCPLTTNVSRAMSPGNVVLRQGEANLRKESVVNVSQIIAIDRSLLDERIGMVSFVCVCQILDGIKLVLEPRETPA